MRAMRTTTTTKIAIHENVCKRNEQFLHQMQYQLQQQQPVCFCHFVVSFDIYFCRFFIAPNTLDFRKRTVQIVYIYFLDSR